MKVHEASKSKKMSNKEFLEEYGEEYNLKSHLSKIPAELEEELFGQEKKIETPEPEPTETVDSAETVVVEVQEPVIEKAPECPYTKEQVRLGIRGCGNKSSMWRDSRLR
jgi:hypothetical protein